MHWHNFPSQLYVPWGEHGGGGGVVVVVVIVVRLVVVGRARITR